MVDDIDVVTHWSNSVVYLLSASCPTCEHRGRDMLTAARRLCFETKPVIPLMVVMPGNSRYAALTQLAIAAGMAPPLYYHRGHLCSTITQLASDVEMTRKRKEAGKK